MLFRIWFYALKLLPVAGLLFAAGFLAPAWGGGMWSTALAIFITLGVIGGCLGLAVFVFGWRFRCPYCGRPGDATEFNRGLALDCDHCGLIHGRFLDYRLRVEQFESQPEDDNQDDCDDDVVDSTGIAFHPFLVQWPARVPYLILALIAIGIAARLLGYVVFAGASIAAAFATFNLWINLAIAAGIIHALRARNWPTADGVVISSCIATEHSGRNRMYSLEVIYRYTVAGRRYRSDRVRYFGPVASGFRMPFMRRIVERYPPGAAIRVYYSPRDPSDAVLEPGLGFAAYFAAAFALFMLGILVLGAWNLVVRIA